MDPPIEFHEDEYVSSPLSDEALSLVAFFNGPECATKLLYRGDYFVRLLHKRSRSLFPLWTKPDSGSHGLIRVPEDAESEEEAAPVYTMAYSG